MDALYYFNNHPQAPSSFLPICNRRNLPKPPHNKRQVTFDDRTMANITYPLLFIFALSPSFIWLAFYLRKDTNPEPNRMIIKIFLGGVLMTIPAILFENFLEGFFSAIISNRTLFLFI